MPRILKIILIIFLFIGFFEAGLFSSFTIVTSDIPDIKGLIDIQIDAITGFFSQENVEGVLFKDPDVLNVTNPVEVADALTSLTKVDGVNIDDINATTYENGDDIQVNVNALGYSSANESSSQIILSQTPDYQIVASATGKKVGGGVEIDISTVKIVSLIKLYSG
jgi:hypothetical protein